MRVGYASRTLLLLHNKLYLLGCVHIVPRHDVACYVSGDHRWLVPSGTLADAGKAISNADQFR